MAGTTTTDVSKVQNTFALPRVTIQFCTQCKWMLRAAYFAQELLSTFSGTLGEVALQPTTGGIFIVTITHEPPSNLPNARVSAVPELQTLLLWDRKAEGGFPETKELKRRVRDVIDPTRDLGHVDKNHVSASKDKDKDKDAEAAATTQLPALPLRQHPVPARSSSVVDPKTHSRSKSVSDVAPKVNCEDCS